MLEERHEVESFELAATMKQLAGRNVAIHDPACRVGQHHHQRSRLDHSVQEQFALMEVEAFAAQQIAERIVGSDEVPKLVVGDAPDAHAEIVITHADDTVAYRAQNARPWAGNDSR